MILVQLIFKIIYLSISFIFLCGNLAIPSTRKLPKKWTKSSQYQKQLDPANNLNFVYRNRFGIYVNSIIQYPTVKKRQHQIKNQSTDQSNFLKKSISSIFTSKSEQIPNRYYKNSDKKQLTICLERCKSIANNSLWNQR